MASFIQQLQNADTSSAREAKKYEDVFKPWYTNSSLQDDMDVLSDPSEVIENQMILNLVLKFFYEYIFPGNSKKVLKVTEIAKIFSVFKNEASSYSRRSDAFIYVLRMISDLKKTAHLIRALLMDVLQDEVFQEGDNCLDIGTGSGILMIAQHILACRSKIRGKLNLYGLEREQEVASYTNARMKQLGIGEVLCEDAGRTKTYQRFVGKQIASIGNETIPCPRSPIMIEDFYLINEMLFLSFQSQELDHTSFFPQYGYVYENRLPIDPPASKLKTLETHPNPSHSLVNLKTKQFFTSLVDTSRCFLTHLNLEGEPYYLSDIGEPFAHMLPSSNDYLFGKRW